MKMRMSLNIVLLGNMRVYDFWDYSVVAVEVIHFACLLGVAAFMFYLLNNEIKKFK
jgi:hypothetical protein